MHTHTQKQMKKEAHTPEKENLKPRAYKGRETLALVLLLALVVVSSEQKPPWKIEEFTMSTLL